MSPEKTKILLERYPKIFRQHKLPMTQTAMCWGFDCGDGWFHILDALCASIENALYNARENDKDSDKENVGLEATQVKEKYGTLRFYYGVGGVSEGYARYIDGLVSMAEHMSGRTCERCGAPGKTVGGGWLTTLCKTCDGGENAEEYEDGAVDGDSGKAA